MRYTFKSKQFNFLHPNNTDHLDEFIIFLMREHGIRNKFWNIKKDDLVIDVGAYFGSYTLSALVMGARVIAIEPNMESILNLLRNVSMNPGFRQHWMKKLVRHVLRNVVVQVQPMLDIQIP